MGPVGVIEWRERVRNGLVMMMMYESEVCIWQRRMVVEREREKGREWN